MYPILCFTTLEDTNNLVSIILLSFLESLMFRQVHRNIYHKLFHDHRFTAPPVTEDTP